jgi:acyl-CoA thioesterase I
MKIIVLLGFASWLLLSSGCRSTRTTAKTDTKGRSYLALGDSYTIGESVKGTDRYPVQLAEALTANGIPVETQEIVARTGWTTSDLQRGIAAAKIGTKTYDFVTLLIGVNNEFRQLGEAEYGQEFTALLEQAIVFADGNRKRVFVLSIPDYGYTPYGKDRQTEISPRIDRFNQINKRIADSMNVHYTDITPISRKGFSDPSLIASDGLHPSGKMYTMWVEELEKAVEKALED